MKRGKNRIFNFKRRFIMNINEYLRLIAGIFIIISLVFSQVHSPYWLFFTLFIALNLIQSAFTKWCPMMYILRLFGVKDN